MLRRPQYVLFSKIALEPISSSLLACHLSCQLGRVSVLYLLFLVSEGPPSVKISGRANVGLACAIQRLDCIASSVLHIKTCLQYEVGIWSRVGVKLTVCTYLAVVAFTPSVHLTVFSVYYPLQPRKSTRLAR